MKDFTFPGVSTLMAYAGSSRVRIDKWKLLSALIAFSFISLSGVNAMNEQTNRRFLALGDSYTIGESVEPEERWPSRLVAMLRDEGFVIADPTIIAKTGWTTDELDEAIDQVSPKGPFDIVSLLIGVNNQYRGRDAKEYRNEFAGLLSRAITFAGGEAKRVIVISIPDWGVTPFAGGRDRDAIAESIDEFNGINREETEKRGAWYVDITPRSRDAATDTSLLAPDGLHPSGILYAEWARQVFPIAVGILKKK